jgi:lactoylglutathione lyase
VLTRDEPLAPAASALLRRQSIGAAGVALVCHVSCAVALQLGVAALFSHVFLSVTDFDSACRFYRPLMALLQVQERFCDPAKPWIGWHSEGRSRPFFVISKPFDGQRHHPGNGQMVAFTAKSREMVRAAHAQALLAGGTCEGEPGLRPQYHANYYGAYLRDPDGNKLCIVCHDAQGEAGDG